MENSTASLMEVRGGGKSFNQVYALNNVNFSLKKGEILGLIGDNGAGKSTLIKALSGALTLDRGDILIKGQKVKRKRYNVKTARKLGIETVYQERSLGEKQPLWRNIFMGRHHTNRFGFINVKREKKETLKILQTFLGLKGVGISSKAHVKTLSGGERQGLAIGRAIYFDADIVILDEPTTALSVQETRKVLDFITEIKRRGKSCIFISHNMSHLFQVADRFIFLKKGTVVDEALKKELTLEKLTQKLIHFSQK